MPYPNQGLVCAKGDTFAFEIDMQTNPDDSPPNLSGATASWVLAESWFEGAKIYITKTSGQGIFINNDAGTWKVIVALDPADTISVPAGLLYHEAKVTLADGGVSHVASGDFVLQSSAAP